MSRRARGSTAARVEDTRRRRWIGALVLAGVFYAVVGIVFAWPASHVRMWRAAAWIVCAAAYAIHIGYERFALGNAPRRAAVHVGLAVALGAFGLALAANIHSLSVPSASAHRRLLLAALVIWPIITGVPASLVALVASASLARLRAR